MRLINFRDLGGLKTRDGRCVKSERILRSGEVVDVSNEDVKTLQHEYKLKVIVDFRGSVECARRPDDEIAGTRYYNFDILKDVKVGTGMDDLLEEAGSDHAVEGMKKVYHSMISKPCAQTGYRQFVKLLAAQEDGALLFHCFAGKDRTGVGAAIVLTMLGVSRDAIFEDYLKTNELRKEANRVLIEQARNKGYNDRQLEHINELMGVRSEFLEEAYQAAKKQFGSFEEYIELGLGLGKEITETLRMNYLSDGSVIYFVSH